MPASTAEITRTEPAQVVPSRVEYRDRDLLVGVEAGVGRIVLHRPRAINALSMDMVVLLHAVLSAWADDPGVEAVELSGTGARGFCSGADVRQLRATLLEDPARVARFFDLEYALDELIATYPKPVTAFLHGVSMGGGLGLGQHASRTVAEPDLQWAMPETGIGFFPDTGVLHELSRMPGECGTHLALTGLPLDAQSAHWAGLVDQVDHEDPTIPHHTELAAAQWWIDECYASDDPAEIVHALEDHWFEDARDAAAVIRGRSPLSVAVTLRAIRRARRLPDVRSVLAQDRVLAHHFLWESDFVEGVRAQLVDKDHCPHWWHARIEDVPAELVAAKFEGCPPLPAEPEATERDAGSPADALRAPLQLSA